jgi:hypothetical protein
MLRCIDRTLFPRCCIEEKRVFARRLRVPGQAKCVLDDAESDVRIGLVYDLKEHCATASLLVYLIRLVYAVSHVADQCSITRVVIRYIIGLMHTTEHDINVRVSRDLIMRLLVC